MENIQNNQTDPFLTEDYKYEAMTNEKLIRDRASQPVKIKSFKEIYNDFLTGDSDFQVYYRGNVIFDSSNTDRKNIVFEENNFFINGNRHEYGGVQIIKKEKKGIV